MTHYTAKVKDTGELVETTIEDEAKALGVHDPTRRYEPRLIAVGDGWVLKGVDEALGGASVGDKLVIDVPPEKGFGARDPDKVRMIPLRKFGEKAGEIGVGDEVEVDNKLGIVRFVGSGRAQVDFNHRFAGKTLTYELQVVKKLETDQEKIIGLVRRRLPVEEEKLKLSLENGVAKVELPSDSYLLEGLQIIKRAISSDLFKYVKSVTKAQFVETYEAPKPKEIVKKVEPEAPVVTEKKEPEAPPAAPPPLPAAPAPVRQPRRRKAGAQVAATLS